MCSSSYEIPYTLLLLICMYILELKFVSSRDGVPGADKSKSSELVEDKDGYEDDFHRWVIGKSVRSGVGYFRDIVG